MRSYDPGRYVSSPELKWRQPGAFLQWFHDDIRPHEPGNANLSASAVESLLNEFIGDDGGTEIVRAAKRCAQYAAAIARQGRCTAPVARILARMGRADTAVSGSFRTGASAETAGGAMHHQTAGGAGTRRC